MPDAPSPAPPPPPAEPYALVCRPGYERDLAGELAGRAGPGAPPPAVLPGLVPVPSELAGPVAARAAPLVFERQRLAAPRRFAGAPLKPAAREVLRAFLPRIAESGRAWALHAYAADPGDAGGAARRARRLERAVLDAVADRFSLAARRRTAEARGADLVLQLCLAADGWRAALSEAAALSDPAPGGVHRMADDPRAPSRSYLKLEEAFDLLGERPAPGQTAVDLGAAPGGWTCALLRRGCDVTAVDNGPLRLAPPWGPGARLTHLRRDGLSYAPDPAAGPVDWLVSDMLQPAGPNLGMLRRWFGGRRMRRFVVNLKLPQEEAWPALRPVEEFLAGVPRCRWRLRHLYHDRREVTLLGRLDG